MKWLERIQRAKKRGHFLLSEKDLASHWDKCMISERPNTQMKHDFMYEKCIPKSQRLQDLGREFYRNVMCDDFDGALDTRKEILKRR